MQNALAAIAEVRKKSSSAVVFVSFGKDSLALLDLVYPRFERVVCVFMYFVEGLEHIDRYLRYCKSRYPNAEWMQVEHWNLSYIRRAGLYCEPHPEERLRRLADVCKEVRAATGIDWVFLGMKKADSLNRRLMLMQYEKEHYTHNGCAYPLAEMTNGEILAYVRSAKLPSPVIYGKGSSGGVGFNAPCFLWLKEHCPQDLERIYSAFPLSRRILFELGRKAKTHRNGQNAATNDKDDE